MRSNTTREEEDGRRFRQGEVGEGTLFRLVGK
jgi:hypothetical protein